MNPTIQCVQSWEDQVDDMRRLVRIWYDATGWRTLKRLTDSLSLVYTELMRLSEQIQTTRADLPLEARQPRTEYLKATEADLSALKHAAERLRVLNAQAAENVRRSGPLTS